MQANISSSQADAGVKYLLFFFLLLLLYEKREGVIWGLKG